MFRFCPDRPLPPYSYVPGYFPHPISDPSGHSYKLHVIPAETQHPDSCLPIGMVSEWKQSSDYLFGIDLFNHGFYWEAHELWERLWIEFGRSGRDADFIKGLIKLAAAGVKAREGRSVGVQRHVSRARELFLLVSENLKDNGNQLHLGGLDLQSLSLAAEGIAENAVRLIELSGDLLKAVLPLRLSPADPESEKLI